MKKNIHLEKIFGVETKPLFEAIYTVYDGIQQKKYGFIDIEVFNKLLVEDLKAANKQYMLELLQRIQLSSSLSIIRNLRWYEGVYYGYKNKNFLSFASSLRGLIESTGDTLFSLQHMGITLAEEYAMICEVLRGERGNDVIIAEEMENTLIHFTHARKYKKGEEVENNAHNAESAHKYVKELERFKKGYLELYADLCQIVHPAKESVYSFVNEKNYVIKIQKNTDLDNIEKLIKKYENLIRLLPELSFNAPLINLKTLNRLPLNYTRTIILESINLDKIRSWNLIEQKIKSQE